MKLFIPIVFIVYATTIVVYSLASEMEEKDKALFARGTFEVNLEVKNDEVAPSGRMIISKEYSGDLVGSGIGQMISKKMDNGVAVYAAIEEFEGSVVGKKGSFTLIHNGHMTSNTQSLDINILQGSGTGELQDISGSLDIIMEEGQHKYKLIYEL